MVEGAVNWQSLKLRDAMKGMRTMASLLHKTLIEVKIPCCENPSAVASLRSLEPVQDLIERLHVDCVRDGCEEHEYASKKKEVKEFFAS